MGMTTAERLITPAQLRALQSSVNSRPIPGLIQFMGAGTGVGLKRAGWDRMMAALCGRGLARPYVHDGEYEITDAGRAILEARAA